MRIFFDESGFTGEDLANANQPVFVLASTRAEDALCKKIFDQVFEGVQSPELKHSSLARTERGRRRILSFLTAIRGSRLFAAWVAHKEFCLLTKLVDLWLETALFEHGIDFYDRGASRGFCNMAWFCLRTFESQAFLTKHLAAFQEMVRTRSLESYRAFWTELYQDSRSSRKETREILSHFFFAESQFGYERMLVMPERTLDICQTSALQAVGYWRGQTTEDFQVIHDSSSNMAREKWIWDTITCCNFPAFRVGPADFLVEYPLRVTDTTFAPSSDHLQLQFADIIAGATAAWAQSLVYEGKKSEYADALKDAGIAEHLIGGIWPTPDIEPTTREPGTIGASEYIETAARAIVEAQKKRSKDR
jgi:uncharacterized protein DUF3800